MKSIKHSRMCILRSLKADGIIGKFSTRGKKHGQRAAGLVEAYLLESGKLKRPPSVAPWQTKAPRLILSTGDEGCVTHLFDAGVLEDLIFFQTLSSKSSRSSMRIRDSCFLHEGLSVHLTDKQHSPEENEAFLCFCEDGFHKVHRIWRWLQLRVKAGVEGFKV